MKRKIWILAALTALIVNGEDRQPAKKASAKKNPPPPAELTVPAGATLVEPGTYTFTDAKGKKWIYRQTPFGVARREDNPVEAAPAPAADAMITAAEDGDTIRFERPGPFGIYRWQKKKSELSADERAAWERSRAAKAKQE
jgi:hypothetical protein